jgi:hypothetical protein
VKVILNEGDDLNEGSRSLDQKEGNKKVIRSKKVVRR